MKLIVVILAGIVGSYLLGSALEALAWRGAGEWGGERRGRLLKAMQGWDGRLRYLDHISFVLILLCVLRLNGIFGVVRPLYAGWGLVAAVVIMALERILRGWLTWRLFAVEGDDRDRKRALLAAVAATILQAALIVWILNWAVANNCGFIFPRGGQRTPTQTIPGTKPTDSNEGVAKPEMNELWMTEAEALRYCGKDKAYLDLLAIHVRGMFAEPLRGEVEGRTVYRRDYLEQLKMGGFPSLEEIRNAQPHGDVPAPKPPKPLTEEELLKE